MGLTHDELTQIVVRAGTLAERLTPDFLPVQGGDALAKRRLLRLKQLAGGNAEWASRLRSLSPHVAYTEQELLARLGTLVGRVEDARLPEWAGTLTELTDGIARGFARAEGERGTNFSRRGSVPFEHLLAPVTTMAWDKAQRVSRWVAPKLTSAARRHLQAHLLRRISDVVSLALYPSFLAHKAFTTHGFSAPLPDEPTAAGVPGDQRQAYRQFVISQGQDGLAAFFVRHPAAARLTAEVVMHWVEFVREFLERLESDWPALERAFGQGQPLGMIEALKTGVSDAHHRGRSVIVLSFSNGAAAVYKPRSLAVDQMFFELTLDLNRSGRVPDLQPLLVLDRSSYGWMEFAPRLPCRSRQAVKRFYRRCGALTCLVHYLGGIDCHRENLVASGEHPILVDLETLAHPVRTEERDLARAGTPWSLDGSVMRTGLLPLWHPKPSGSGMMDNSAFGAPLVQSALLPTLRWRRLNTDRMECCRAVWSNRRDAHRPRYRGRVQSVEKHESEVCAGYQRMAAQLEGPAKSHYAQLRQRIVQTVRRCIHRPTLIYAYLIQRSLSPDCLVEGVDRSIELHALPILDGESQVWLKEIVSLEHQDVPYFTLDARSHAAPTTTVSGLPQVQNQIPLIRLALRRQLWLEGPKVQVLGGGKRPESTEQRQYARTED